MSTVSVDGTAPCGRSPRREALRTATRYANRFAAAVSALHRDTVSASGIPGVSGPQVTHVELGRSPYIMVRLLPGQMPSDVEQLADRIACALAVRRIRVTERIPGTVRIDLNPPPEFANDPHAMPSPLDNGLFQVEFGQTPTGTILRESLVDTGHLASQGQTGSGKTRWSYSVLAQLSGARHVVIDGIDPTGKLLGPWENHAQTGLICGTSEYEAMEATSADLVKLMRRRIADIPRDQDSLPVGADHPLRLVYLEEWGNALIMASIATGKAKGLDTPLGKNISMLLAESRKAGMRLVLVSQRFDSSLIGGGNRDNISHRFSFRTASKDGLKMLHDHITDDLAELHAAERAGIALIQTPTHPLQRIRAAHVPSYSDYLAAVDRSRGGAVDTAA